MRVLDAGCGSGRNIVYLLRCGADVCAVDCVTHALIAAYRPAALQGTRILERTQRAPGLPYVTRAGKGEEHLRRLRDALQSAFADSDLASARDALLITGIHMLDDAAYRRIDDMENSARAAGYAEIH